MKLVHFAEDQGTIPFKSRKFRPIWSVSTSEWSAIDFQSAGSNASWRVFRFRFD